MMSNSESRKRLAEAQRGDEAGDVTTLEDWLIDHRWPDAYDLSHSILASDWLAAREAAAEARGAKAVLDDLLTRTQESILSSGFRQEVVLASDVRAARAAAQQVSER